MPIEHDPEFRRQRAKVAGLSRFRDSDDPELVAARGVAAETIMFAAIADALEKGPPITPERRARIIAMFSE